MGSQLEVVTPFSLTQLGGILNYSYAVGDVIWDPPMNTTPQKIQAVTTIRALKCNTDGSSYYDLIPKNNNYGAQNTYEYLYEGLKNQFENNYDIKFFAYDWRMSNDKSADKLNTFINTNGYDKVVLVAHSMGGLVASNYIYKYPSIRGRIEKLITLGTPFFGSLDMISTYCNKELPIKLDPHEELYVDFIDPLNQVLPDMASIYQLFPTEQYFTVANRTYLSENIGYLITRNYNNYSDTKTALSRMLNNFNSTHMSKAEQVNASLFLSNGNHITSLVDSYYIIGYNKKTLSGLCYYNEYTERWMTKTNTYYGDGTVPAWSADLGGMYPNKTYYAINRLHGDNVTDEFGNITEYGLVGSDNVVNQVVKIINETPDQLQSGITKVKPY